MLQITCVPSINYLPADIICDSFDLVVVQWNSETQTLRRACGAQKAFSLVHRNGMLCVSNIMLLAFGRRGIAQSNRTQMLGCLDIR